MNILIINSGETLGAGGVNKVVQGTAKCLSKRGHTVTVLQTNPFNLLNEEFHDGYRIIRVKSRFGRYLHGLSYEMCFYLRKIINELKPEIVHLHGYHNLFSCEILLILRKLLRYDSPLIFSPHLGVESHASFAGRHLWSCYNNFVGKQIIKIPDKMIASSNFESENIQKFLAVPQKKITQIPHGIDAIDVTKKNRKNGIRLLYVGYLLEIKGVDYLIQTVHELVRRNVNVNLIIIGEGPFKASLTKLAKKLKVQQHLQWKSFIPPSQLKVLLKCYKNADIVLLLSRSENYGIVVPEALAMGTPVIVTRRTSLTEFLNEPGCFGVSYPPDPKEVADLIIKIYESDQQVGPFSDKIRMWDEVTKDYENVYVPEGNI